MPPEMVNGALGWYMAHQDKMAEAQNEIDDNAQVNCEDTLRKEWPGDDYRINNNLANAYLDSAPEGVKENWLGARLADGTPLGNDPDTIKFLAQSQRELNPVATVVPGTGEGAMQAITSEMNELRTLMGDRASKYWKGPEANKLQSRYEELVSAQQRYG